MANYTDDDYEYITDDRLPDGWEIAVWPDGRAMVCSPRTCPDELGGYAATSADMDTAIAETTLPG